mgnify:CR=1 FL=1
MYCIKITVKNTFYISKIEYDDIFKNKELYSPIYKKFKNLTMAVNLIKDSENIFINAIASRLFNSGIIYGDIVLLLDNRENNQGAYIELLTEIIKDEVLSNSQKETYKKYGGLFDDDATTSDDETSETDEEEDPEPNDEIKFIYRTPDEPDKPDEIEYLRTLLKNM